MANSSLAKKLLVKPGYRVLILNAPPDYRDQLGDLLDGVQLATSPGGVFDLVQMFVRDRAELAQYGAVAMNAVKPGGIFWACYPKISSKLKSDLTRDKGWEAVKNEGWQGVAMISIDDTWSAMRFVKK